jgi:HEAT repeat protein
MMIDNTEIKVRQTSVYALGEIGKKDAESIIKILEKALIDKHHAVNNAVIGALKQMGQKNPVPTIKFASKHLHDDDPMVRRQIIHGIELRGRNHPNEVLPLLKELQYEENKKVRNMIIHVIGQISYKTGSLEKVIDSLKSWNNRELVCESAEEILNVHARYKFSARSPEDAKKYIEMNIPKLLNGNKN